MKMGRMHCCNLRVTINKKYRIVNFVITNISGSGVNNTKLKISPKSQGVFWQFDLSFYFLFKKKTWI